LKGVGYVSCRQAVGTRGALKKAEEEKKKQKKEKEKGVPRENPDDDWDEEFPCTD